MLGQIVLLHGQPVPHWLLFMVSVDIVIPDDFTIFITVTSSYDMSGKGGSLPPG